jgi:hypothetical protein
MIDGYPPQQAAPPQRKCGAVTGEVDTRICTGLYTATPVNRYTAISANSAPGALVLTDTMPFSIETDEVYISLVPIISPLTALRTKYNSPLLDPLRT